MATINDNTDTDREETQAERMKRLDLERDALRPNRGRDSLRDRLLTIVGLNQHAQIAHRGGCSHERALFRYAAATTKAVGMALMGTDMVCSNEPFETSFTSDEAAFVLCGLSALLEEGPDLIEDLRYADEGLHQSMAAADDEARDRAEVQS